MTLENLREYLLINSLQYFIGQDDIEVTDEVLNGLVKRALKIYSNWRPLFYQSNIQITEHESILKTDDKGRRIQNIVNIFYYSPIISGEKEAVVWNWDYNKDNGYFRSELLGKYVFELLVLGTLEDYDDTTSELMEMILALYMMYIGSSRKAFSFGEQPFENDGGDIYSDGKELWEKTLEELKESQDNWYLSII